MFGGDTPTVNTPTGLIPDALPWNCAGVSGASDSKSTGTRTGLWLEVEQTDTALCRL